MCWLVFVSCGECSRNEESNDNNEQNAVVTIDAGDKVWCMAFGSRSTRVRRQSNLITFRYVVFDDTILAAGLQNGRIRTWDVKTGKWYLCWTLFVKAIICVDHFSQDLVVYEALL